MGANDKFERESVEFVVLQADGMTAAIKTLLADESEKYLGMRGRLDGSPADHLVDMRKKIEEWMEAIKAGTLPTRLVWKSYQHQL